MENATKALIMAAGILIGVLILSLGVVLFNTFGGFASDTQSKVDANQLDMFNEKFLKYDGRTDLTIQDIITVRNYALDNNNQFTNYKWHEDRAGEDNDYVDVYKFTNKIYVHTEGNSGLIFLWTDEDLLEKDLENGEKLTQYTCGVKKNNNTGRVNKVYFYETEE